ncbi:exonuclease [Myxococcota bacterium]|nr:exonuclease [Myxococcota bacterium]
MREVFVSTDVEADGPIPGPHSMLSLGAAAFTAEKELVSTFEVNLHTLPGAAPDEATMAWWKGFPDAYAAARKDPVDPAEAMGRFGGWVKGLGGKPVLLVYPAWDYLWVHWYMVRFVGRSPFGLGALDIKSYLAALMDEPFHEVSKRNMAKRWFDPGLDHTHRALDDAKEQGALFCNVLAERRQRLGKLER